jgi:iron complex outermembrane receptor protein
MKKILLFIIFLGCTKLYAQQTRISGTITDSLTKQPINGASITVKGKIAGTITDSKGNYSLNTDRLKFPLILQISTVGYGNKEITVSSPGNSNNISLNPIGCSA